MNDRAHLRPRAVSDLHSLTAYLAERNPSAAHRFVNATEDGMKQLAEVPGIGAHHRSRSKELQAIRAWPIAGFRNYIVYYLPLTGGGIEVLRILHGARRPDRLLREA